MSNKEQNLKNENAALKREIKQLKKERSRDKSAMAEALALLTLKKKVAKLFDSEEED